MLPAECRRSSNLQQHGYVTGGAEYFGHSGPLQWKDLNTGLEDIASEIFVGQGVGEDTNITGQNIKILTDVQKSNNGSNNIGKNAAMTLNGCMAGMNVNPDHYFGYETSIAQQISVAVQRGVFAYDIGTYFSHEDATHDPYVDGTDKYGKTRYITPGLPMYMIPYGEPGDKEPLLPFCSTGSCPKR